jgi:hypothetical protein
VLFYSSLAFSPRLGAYPTLKGVWGQ